MNLPNSLWDKKIWGKYECRLHGISFKDGNIYVERDYNPKNKPFIFNGIPETEKEFEMCLTSK